MRKIILTTLMFLLSSNIFINSLQIQVFAASVHIVPSFIEVVAVQTAHTVFVDITANFNETEVQMDLGNVTMDWAGTYTVEVICIRISGPSPGSLNLSVTTTLGIPAEGNHTLYVKEPVLNTVLATKNFTVVPTDILFSEEGVVASLRAYLDYNQTEFKAVPPMLYNQTRLWVNASSTLLPLTLGIRLNNTMDQTLNDVILYLSPPQSVNFNLTPTQWAYGSLSPNSSNVGYFNLTTRDVPVGVYNITYTLNYTNADGPRTKEGLIPAGVYVLNANWNLANQTGIAYLTSPFYDNQTSLFHNYTTLETIDGYNFTTWQNYNYTITYHNFTVRTNPIWLPIVLIAALKGAAVGAIIGAGVEALRQLISGESTRITPGEATKKIAVAGALSAPTGAITGAAPLLNAALRPINTPIGQYYLKAKKLTNVIDRIEWVDATIELGEATVEGIKKLTSSASIEYEERNGDPPTISTFEQSLSGEMPHFDPAASSSQGSNVIYGPPPPDVGGIVVPVDEFGLLAPYIGLASTVLVAAVAAVIYVKRVWRRKERQ